MRIPLLVAALMLPIAAAAEIHPSPEEVRPLLPGMAAPAFRLVDLEGRAREVDPSTLDKPLVLTFYRGGWCPYCNLHLAELRRTEGALRDMGFEIWFASPDRPALLSEGDEAGFGYRLFSDPALNAARAFGIAFRVDDATHERYLGAGIDLNARAGTEMQALPAPATFIIGTDGRIRFAYVNPDYTVRLAPAVLEAAARAYVEDADARLRRARAD